MKYISWLIILICIVYGLSVQASPLPEVNHAKRCDPGDGPGCGSGDCCDCPEC
ncbi:5352_t:CDS:2 [Dentiscutata erythropus]|uniref:5352_t:CDS:1 n=1 Tax=Dentiscutata erythropus TaxID=1348616 RepID=A0A9N8VE94_9GLOM|nr:5352_t:CDS:2 [Dentiscutata erythropus]